ncbi:MULTISPECIES: hypothetical protein [Streptomyces]|uniref:hypothetical protein n=1 Tax=Streptomyces TaxID=1883 RepID=UPI000525865B|nr:MULTISPECIES: hypothetical protein [Streptomyces]
MRAVRLASVVATTAVLLAGATACGGSKGGNDTKSGDAKGSDAKGGDPIAAALTADPKAALAASALVMQKAGNGKVSMISPDDAKGGGTGDADWKDPGKVSVDLVGDMGSKKLKIRVIGADAYLGGDGAALGGKHWVKLPAGNEAGDGFRAAGQMLNPVVVLTVAAQSGKLSKVGQEPLDGAQTTHLRAVEDTSALVAGMSALPADQRQAVQKTLEQDGKTLTFDFWLNGKQELAQYQEYGETNGAKDAVTVKYSDLGKAAAITAPAATDLGSEADLLKLLG